MSTWFQPLLVSFVNEQSIPELPFQSVFDGLYFPEHKLCLHFISIDTDRLNKIPPTYFMEMSESAPHLKLIHIWEDMYTQHPELVLARIQALMGNRKRIHGRTTEVKRIDKTTAEGFLNTHHLQQYVTAYYKYGLYHKEELVAVATFSKSRIMQDEIIPYRSYELIRFASKAGITVTGGLSKLLRAFINEVHPAHIMTYADRDWGSGEGYEKLGFNQVANNPPSPFYINLTTLLRTNANQLIREGLTLPDEMLVFNAGSLKYTLPLTDYIS
jgi:hypothetical protein